MKLRPWRTLRQRVALKAEVAQNKSRVRRFKAHYGPIADGLTATLVPRAHPYPGMGHRLSAVLSAALWADDLGAEFAVPRGEVFGPVGLFSFREIEVQHSAPQLRVVPDERTSGAKEALSLDMRRRARGSGSPIWLALDQYRWDLTRADGLLRNALQAGTYGSDLAQLEERGHVAVHLRRGDVAEQSIGRGSGISRWKPVEWYFPIVDELT